MPFYFQLHLYPADAIASAKAIEILMDRKELDREIMENGDY